MNQENTGLSAVEASLKKKFQNHEWVSVKNDWNNIRSKFYIKKEFHHEHKTNFKKIRFNKRNPTKTLDYYQQYPLYKDANVFLDFNKVHDRIYQNSIPNTITYTYEGLGSRIYNCNFTNDGRSLLATTQHGTSFFKFSEDNKVELSKVISCQNVNWAITDSDVSSNNKFMIHSTLSPNIHIFDLEEGKYSGNFTLKGPEQENNSLNDFISFFSLRVYSLKLSSDNKQIIVGCGKTIGGAPVQVFDIEANKVKHSIIAHSDDINSICFLDKQNSSVFISASDDGVSKLWDTRTMENNKPAGIFYGHVSGLTYVTSKEDDKYFITNCKDQSIKLWDIRKSTTQKMNYPFLKFDYRYEILSQDHIEEIKRFQKKVDNAVMTFWGHQVHMSLIRCHFSPMHGTAQRYIYTGSYDGRIYIYDTISGQNVACLETTNNDPNALNSPVIRDCAWHPYSNTLVSTNFIGEIHKWEYQDLRDGERMEIEDDDKYSEGSDLIRSDSSTQRDGSEHETVMLGRSLLRDNM